ncbi:hypothetical protein I4U23_002398 [Adineta vaga]|nr:hypothetical protein I4U23_002398 [Adineta vaga]
MVQTAKVILSRALASFDSQPNATLEVAAENLIKALVEYITVCSSKRTPISIGLINQLISLIDTILQKDSRSTRPLELTDGTLRIIYNILQLLHDKNKRYRDRINSILFNQKDRLLLFPGTPAKEGWKFTSGKFLSQSNTNPKHSFSLHYVQHVVHDIDDVLKMLQNVPNKVQFQGFFNHNYGGSPLCWFGPVPPPWTNKVKPICDSLDPGGSRYGCFRFTIPFRVLFQKFPTSFILGTRKYNQENCHTILLTKSNIKYILLQDRHQPVELTDTTFIKKSTSRNESITNTSFEWLCYNDSRKHWDQLEFAVAASELQFDPEKDGIRLDFVNHGKKVCVISRRTRHACTHAWDKRTAMEKFLLKLKEENIKLSDRSKYFTDEVWEELLAINDSLSSKRFKSSN